MSAREYEAYPEYADTNSDWLGLAPKHWRTIPVGRLFTRIKRMGHSDKELLSVYRDFGVIPKSSRDDNNNKPSDDLSPYQLVQINDLVMNKMKTWQGSLAVSEFEGIVSPAYFVYQPLERLFEFAHPKYVHYLLRNPMYIAQYLRRSKGIRVSQWDLDPDEFQRVELLLPTKAEQLNIFSFLDYETAKIDTLIEKQQQLIKLLKEKRQAVISHAVTKGLSLDVPMRDSGVEWLGEVPEHWEVRAVSKLSKKITNGYVGPTRDILVQKGIPYVQATHIKKGKVNFDDAYFVRQTWSEKHSKSILTAGDVLIVQTGAGTGDIGLVSDKEEGYNCHALIIVQPIKKIVSGDFLAMSFQSQYGFSVLYSIRTGGMHPHLNCGEVKFVKLPVPPKNEQNKIMEHIYTHTRVFDLLIDKQLEAIALMQERRTALISAAVTGKIDVRNWQAPEPSISNFEAMS